MDWQECKENKIVKSISVDKNLVESLIESSENKVESQELLVLSNTTAASKVSLSYDALRELLEALAILKGYKVYNHECYCAFLKEEMNESRLGDLFDKQRLIRNSINYYGKKVTVDDAKSSISRIMDLISEIKLLIDKI